MTWWREFAGRIEHDAPLGRRTWFRLGGRGRFLFRPRDEHDLAAMVARARQEDVPIKVLGQGANVLVSDDGFDGVVVRMDGEAFRRVQRHAGQVEVGAGRDLMVFSRQCSEAGLSGLECMAGIPASIGGAVRMNAGGRSGEFSTIVKEVRTLAPDGTVADRSREQVGFSYRHTDLDGCIVLSATLELNEDDPAEVRRRFDECFQQKLRTQPIADKSAGCIFKNPPQGDPAGALIDRAGLKGTRYGNARVSERHANFIVAETGATASDVLHLIDVVRERVRRDFSTELETEIDVWKPLGRRP